MFDIEFIFAMKRQTSLTGPGRQMIHQRLDIWREREQSRSRFAGGPLCSTSDCEMKRLAEYGRCSSWSSLAMFG